MQASAEDWVQAFPFLDRPSAVIAGGFLLPGNLGHEAAGRAEGPASNEGLPTSPGGAMCNSRTFRLERWRRNVRRTTSLVRELVDLVEATTLLAIKCRRLLYVVVTVVVVLTALH